MHLIIIAPWTSFGSSFGKPRLEAPNFCSEFSLSTSRAERFGTPSWILDTAAKRQIFWHRTSLIFIFATNWSVVNNEIKMQAHKVEFKFNTSIFNGFTALIMLFSCVFPTFYENLLNQNYFWTKLLLNQLLLLNQNYFHIKFGDLVSKYLLFRSWKCEIKKL